jgi:hypothetical protein
MRQSLIEQSVEQTRVVDLFDYAEVIISPDVKPWARDGHYQECKLRRHGENKFEDVKIDLDVIERYLACLQTGITPAEYDTHQRVEKLLRLRGVE